MTKRQRDLLPFAYFSETQLFFVRDHMSIPTAKQRRSSTDKLISRPYLTSMPAPLSNDLKDRIVKWYYEDQETMKEIATHARCSIGAVSNILRLYREYGKVKDPFRQRTGRPSKLSEADLRFLDAVVVANPSLYLDEIQKKLEDVREVQVSIATLARALASLSLTRKQITKAASERDEELRTVWEAMMAEYNDPEFFVALDESAVDGRTGQREYGRTQVGNPCVKRMTFL